MSTWNIGHASMVKLTRLFVIQVQKGPVKAAFKGDSRIRFFHRARQTSLGIVESHFWPFITCKFTHILDASTCRLPPHSTVKLTEISVGMCKTVNRIRLDKQRAAWLEQGLHRYQSDHHIA